MSNRGTAVRSVPAAQRPAWGEWFSTKCEFCKLSCMTYDTAFQLAASNIRFGAGITREAGMDLAELGARRVMLVIDPALVDLPTGAAVLEALRTTRIDFALYDQVRVEPTDAGFQEAAKFAVAEKVD